MTQAATIKAPPKGLTPVVSPTAEHSLAIPEYKDDGGVSGSLAALMYFGPKAKGDRPEECKAAGVQHHEFYLKDSLGVVKLSPARIFPIGNQTKAFVQFDDEMNMMAACAWSTEKPADRNGMRWSELIFGPCLVPNNDDTALSPVIFQTNGPLCRLWKNINDAQRMTGGDGSAYALRGANEKAAASCPSPIGRFVARIWGKEEVPAPPKMKYNLGFSAISPTNEKQRHLVVETLKHAGLAGLLGVFNRRNEDLSKLMAKG